MGVCPPNRFPLRRSLCACQVHEWLSTSRKIKWGSTLLHICFYSSPNPQDDCVSTNQRKVKLNENYQIDIIKQSLENGLIKVSNFLEGCKRATNQLDLYLNRIIFCSVHPRVASDVWCQTTLRHPSVCPPLLILYPPLFRSQTVLCFPQQVLMPSSLKLEIFGKRQGTRRIFLFFCVNQ